MSWSMLGANCSYGRRNSSGFVNNAETPTTENKGNGLGACLAEDRAADRECVNFTTCLLIHPNASDGELGNKIDRYLPSPVPRAILWY